MDNSYEAFQDALLSGADGLECDVRLSADGHLVLSHDAKITTLEGKELSIAENTLENLRENAPTIITLEDLFTSFADSCLYDLELKCSLIPEPLLIKRTWEAIEKHKLEKKTIVSSFNPLALQRFKHISHHQIPLALLFDDEQNVPRPLRNGGGRHLCRVDMLAPGIHVSKTKLSSLTHLPFAFWPVNDVKTARSATGARIIITDTIEKMVKEFRNGVD